MSATVARQPRWNARTTSSNEEAITSRSRIIDAGSKARFATLMNM